MTSFNRYLNDDILSIVFEYFNPHDMLVASEVSKLWLSVTRQNDKQLWERHCLDVWKDTTVNVPDFSDINVMSRIKSLSLLQIKRALMRVDITRCIEKIDFQRMFLAKLLFDNRSVENKTTLRTYYPEWALKLNLYKATYFHALLERNRTEMFLSELCAIEWHFHFKNELDEEHIRANIAVPYCRFKQDFTVDSAIQHENPFHWQFVTSGKDGITRIQIEMYPAYTQTRLPNGAWHLDQPHVYMDQIGSIPPENLPII